MISSFIFLCIVKRDNSYCVCVCVCVCFLWWHITPVFEEYNPVMFDFLLQLWRIYDEKTMWQVSLESLGLKH